MKLVQLFTATWIAVAPLASGWADVITLQDGRVVEGTVQQETDVAVWIDVGEGTLVFPRTEIETVERGVSTERSLVRMKRWTWQAAHAALRHEELHEALRLYVEAIRLSPRNPHLYNNLGVCLARLWRDDEAIRAFREALTLDPTHAAARLNLVRLYHGRDDFQAALLLLEPLLEHTDDAAIWQYGGLLWYLRGDLEEAIRAYEHAMGFAPLDPAGWYDLGCLYARHGQHEEATGAFRRVVSLDDRHADAYDALGQLFALGGLPALAKDSYLTAHQLQPENRTYLRHLASILTRLDEPKLARRVMERIAALDLDATLPRDTALLPSDTNAATLELEPTFEAPLRTVEQLETIVPPGW